MCPEPELNRRHAGFKPYFVCHEKSPEQKFRALHFELDD